MENIEQLWNTPFTDEDGNEFEMIDLFEIGEDNIYGVFAPVLTEENYDDEEVEVEVAKFTKEGFQSIENEKEQLMVFDEFLRRQGEMDEEEE